MIHIREAEPIKLSGLTSLHITFNYEPVIIDAVKSLPTAYYHKAIKTWEVPADLLAEVLDKLTFFDDITLQLLGKTECFHFGKKYDLQPLSENEITSFRADPFPHQLEAVNFMLDKERALLLDGCGVGKSLEMILFAETLKKRGLIDHCLIITGIAGLRGNWEREIAKFSTETSVVIGKYTTRNGTTRYRPVAKRAEQLKAKIDEFFVLINVESLRDAKVIEAIKTSENKFGLLMFDEAHLMGTAGTAQFENLKKLQADFMVGATGTLIVNSPLSARGPLFWIGRDHATLTNFKSQYCEFGGFGDKQIVGYKNLSVLREEIDNCSIRRTLHDVRKDMPPLTIETEYLELDEEQQKFYDAIREGVKEEADKIDLKAANLLALTTRLRQATAAPSVLTSQAITSAKVDRALCLIQEIISQGEKVVVFSVFKEPLNVISDALTKMGQIRFSINTGDVPDDVVNQNMAEFQDDPEPQVFLGSCARVGTGLTLNSSMYLIFIDTPYTYSLFEQCFQRVYRVNNSRPAFIKVLVCANTIDERVQEIVATKKDLGEYLVDGKASDGIISEALANELRTILRSL